MRKTALLFLLPVVLAAGCKRSPFERTRDASGGGGLGRFGSGNLIVFSSELKTGGGAFLYPGGNNQDLSFVDMSNPISNRSIRYVWNGQDTGGGVLFAGFDLMHVPLQAQYDTTPGRDLRAAGYTKVTFYARGSLSTDTYVKIEVGDDGISTTHDAACLSLSTDGTMDSVDGAGVPCGHLNQLTGAWQKYTIPITSSNLNPLKDFFKATFVFLQPFPSTAPGQGGTVYLDQIQYEP